MKTSRKHANPINFDTARKIGLALPGVEEGTAYGAPALKVHGKLLACVPTNRSAEPGSLAVRIGFDDRAELLATAPDIYYVTTISPTMRCWCVSLVLPKISSGTC